MKLAELLHKEGFVFPEGVTYVTQDGDTYGSERWPMMGVTCWSSDAPPRIEIGGEWINITEDDPFNILRLKELADDYKTVLSKEDYEEYCKQQDMLEYEQEVAIANEYMEQLKEHSKADAQITFKPLINKDFKFGDPVCVVTYDNQDIIGGYIFCGKDPHSVYHYVLHNIKTSNLETHPVSQVYLGGLTKEMLNIASILEMLDKPLNLDNIVEVSKLINRMQYSEGETK